jgi:hypothetical protein
MPWKFRIFNRRCRRWTQMEPPGVSSKLLCALCVLCEKWIEIGIGTVGNLELPHGGNAFASRRIAHRKLLRVSAPLRENRLFGSAFASFASLAPFALMARKIGLRLCCSVSSVVKNPELPRHGKPRSGLDRICIVILIVILILIVRLPRPPRPRGVGESGPPCLRENPELPRYGNAMDRWICRLFSTVATRRGGVLRCLLPWTEVHGYPRPSLRDFDPRKLNPTSRPSAAPPIESSSASPRPWREHGCSIRRLRLSRLLRLLR